MRLAFLTPPAALAGLVALVPVVAALVRERRARRLRGALGLRAPRPAAHLASALGLLALGLLALAAAQPVVELTSTRSARADAEAFFVFDISRSMLAAPAPGEATRFERAAELGERLRADLAEVPVGVASLSDRVLPHLLPTPDREAFAAVLTRALAVNRPPPLFEGRPRATDLEEIGSLGTDDVFASAAKRRLAVVFTDGESLPYAAEEVADDLREGGVRVVLVRVWDVGERVHGADGGTEPYRPDERSGAELAHLAEEAGGRLLAESDADADALAAAARAALGNGRSVAAGKEEQVVRLAPYAVLAAALPLGLLLVLTSARGRRRGATARGDVDLRRVGRRAGRVRASAPPRAGVDP